MDQYEIRRYPGWNHHILTCELAHFFLWHLKIGLGKKAPSITFSQLRIQIRVMLPMQRFDMEMTLALVYRVQFPDCHVSGNRERK